MLDALLINCKLALVSVIPIFSFNRIVVADTTSITYKDDITTPSTVNNSSPTFNGADGSNPVIVSEYSSIVPVVEISKSETNVSVPTKMLDFTSAESISE